MKRIFVCSPLRANATRDMQENIDWAQHYCAFVVSQGHLPYAPHLLFPQFLDDDNPDERRKGIAMGIQELEGCDELWVFGPPSEGMRQEIKHAEIHGIPVTHYPAETLRVMRGGQCKSLPKHALPSPGAS